MIGLDGAVRLAYIIMIDQNLGKLVGIVIMIVATMFIS